LVQVAATLSPPAGGSFRVVPRNLAPHPIRLDAQLPDPVITAPGAAMPRHFTEPMNRRFQNLLDIIKELS
jgi:hypothetical protein